MKAPLLAELDAQCADRTLFDCMGNWLPVAHVIDPEKYQGVLLEGAWATLYGRYYDWHEQLDKPCNVQRGTRASRNRT